MSSELFEIESDGFHVRTIKILSTMIYEIYTHLSLNCRSCSCVPPSKSQMQRINLSSNNVKSLFPIVYQLQSSYFMTLFIDASLQTTSTSKIDFKTRKYIREKSINFAKKWETFVLKPKNCILKCKLSKKRNGSKVKRKKS